MSFEEEYEKLRTQDQRMFAQVVNTLLFRCYLVRKRFDKATGMDKFQSDYAFCERHYSLIEKYLSYMDVILSRDDDSGVIFVRNEEDRNTVRFNTSTTLVIFAIRIYYEAQIKERPSNLEVLMDSNTLRQQLADLGLSSSTRKISLPEIQSAMKTLAQYNAVVLSKGSFNESGFSFYILPSIKFIIDRERINALYRYLSGESEEEEEESSSVETEAVSEESEAFSLSEGDLSSMDSPAPTGF